MIHRIFGVFQTNVIPLAITLDRLYFLARLNELRKFSQALRLPTDIGFGNTRQIDDALLALSNDDSPLDWDAVLAAELNVENSPPAAVNVHLQ